jgi:hypothetical protein
MASQAFPLMGLASAYMSPVALVVVLNWPKEVQMVVLLARASPLITELLARGITLTVAAIKEFH